ncbi:MAG: TrmH family RNA methyltransferase, partial [Bdellovibrionales bacterium]|nr:TrmH family RNA methyltransferase [Bdellovibrionales bacterium]
MAKSRGNNRSTSNRDSKRPARRGERPQADRSSGSLQQRGKPRDPASVPVIGGPARVGRPGAGPRNSAFMISGRERLSLGIHSVREALKVRPGAIKRLGLRDDYLRAPQLKALADLAEAAKVEIKTLTSTELDNIGSGHQGAAAVITETPEFDIEAVRDLDRCVLVACDGLEDPANLGSILRSSWLLGASGVLVPQDRSVALTTAAAKVASGGAEHVPVEVCSN